MQVCNVLEYLLDYQGHKICNSSLFSFSDTALVLLRRNRHLVTWEDHRGWTPLHYAAYYGFDEIILEMLDKQDEVAGYQFVPRENIPPPFFVAVEEGHLSTVQLYMFSHVIGSKWVSADVNFNGQNILHFMASGKNKQMIKYILRFCETSSVENIDILNQKDIHGNTPLHILIIREGCYVPEFIKSVSIDKNATNNDGWTPVDMLYFSKNVTDDQVRYH